MKKTFNAASRIKICNQCNLQFEEHINICPNCGNTNLTEAMNNNGKLQKKRIKRWLIVFIIVGILVVFFLLVLRPILIEVINEALKTIRCDPQVLLSLE